PAVWSVTLLRGLQSLWSTKGLLESLVFGYACVHLSPPLFWRASGGCGHASWLTQICLGHGNLLPDFPRASEGRSTTADTKWFCFVLCPRRTWICFSKRQRPCVCVLPCILFARAYSRCTWLQAVIMAWG
ncbi:unnamed protein product, partial [Ectocarpus sp. 12 AP-2014]